MDFARSPSDPTPAGPPAAAPPPVDAAQVVSAKIVVAGGFGVGKTTLVGAVWQVPPVNTEAWMTQASEHVDEVDGLPDKQTTTVAMDFGRITLQPDLVLYLFGTPGQPRFWFMWDDLCRGAVGAVVLVDTRRLEVSFPAVNYFDNDMDVPYIVVVNTFDGILTHELPDVREALQLPAEVPLIACDVRRRADAVRALRTVVDHAIERVKNSGRATGALISR